MSNLENGSKEWASEVFDEYYYRIYGPVCNKTAENEVKGIVELLGLKPGQRILDMPCGYGRHSKVFAEKGFSVTGVDLSEHMIKMAERQNCHPNIEYVVGNMKNVNLRRTFDACLNLYISFGFFKNHNANQAVLANFARHLEPQGQLLMELVNPGNALSKSRIAGSRIEEYGDLKAIIKKNIDPNTMWETYQLKIVDKNANVTVKDITAGYYIYSIDEIEEMARESDLELIDYFGGNYHDFSSIPLTDGSARITAIFQRASC